MPKRQSYYREYEASHINSSRFIARAAKQVVKRLGAPFEKSKRGRPLKLEPEKAAVVVITQAAQNKTFRSAEGLAPEIYKHSIDHVTLWRYFSRIGLSYIRRAVPLLFNLIYVTINDAIFMLDSTGISCERSEDSLKLHVLAAYSQEEGKLAIAQAEVTEFNVHDVVPAGMLLVQGSGNYLLGDAAYDSHRFRIIARRKGFIPNIKFRRTSAPTPLEKARGFDFDEAKYRLRGIVEGIFGAGEVRYGNKTRCRLVLNRARDVMLKVLGFNLRVHMRIEASESFRIFILGNYETTPDM
jgi:transposase